MWEYWNFAWGGKGLSASQAYASRQALEGEKQRILREAGPLDEQDKSLLIKYVNKHGLDEILHAMDLCLGQEDLLDKPLISDLRAFILRGVQKVRWERLRKQVVSSGGQC